MAGVGELPNVAWQDAGEIAQYLCGAYNAGAEVDFHRVDGKLWGLALGWLIDRSVLDVATFAAPRLARAYPETRFFHTMAAILARLPAPCDDAPFAAFRDDVTREVQMIPRAGASAVLLGFCGRAQQIGMPLNLIHRWFGHLGVHVIYLRDYQGKNYDNGIRSLAPDLGGTLRALRETIAGLGVQRVVCYGNSLGGYGALRYALELQSEAVLCFGAPTNLVPDFGNIRLREKRGVAPGLDLRPLYQRASRAPRTHLVYAEHHASDRTQASNFAGLPTVSLEGVHGASGHDVFLRVLLDGRYERLVRWLVDPHRRAGAP
jgi:pimeloyl-ACP methyl ester carboxylesterase